jgi:hypothetical protein
MACRNEKTSMKFDLPDPFAPMITLIGRSGRVDGRDALELLHRDGIERCL